MPSLLIQVPELGTAQGCSA